MRQTPARIDCGENLSCGQHICSGGTIDARTGALLHPLLAAKVALRRSRRSPCELSLLALQVEGSALFGLVWFRHFPISEGRHAKLLQVNTAFLHEQVGRRHFAVNLLQEQQSPLSAMVV